MKTILTMVFVAVASAASAHPSLIAHEHPHELSALGGLDMLLLAALVTAIAVAAWKTARG
jgi:hypothetical protein